MQQTLKQQLTIIRRQPGPIMLKVRYGRLEYWVRLTRPAAEQLLIEAEQHRDQFDVYQDDHRILLANSVHRREWSGGAGY